MFTAALALGVESDRFLVWIGGGTRVQIYSFNGEFDGEEERLAAPLALCSFLYRHELGKRRGEYVFGVRLEYADGGDFSVSFVPFAIVY